MDPLSFQLVELMVGWDRVGAFQARYLASPLFLPSNEAEASLSSQLNMPNTAVHMRPVAPGRQRWRGVGGPPHTEKEGGGGGCLGLHLL